MRSLILLLCLLTLGCSTTQPQKAKIIGFKKYEAGHYGLRCKTVIRWDNDKKISICYGKLGGLYDEVYLCR